MVGRASSRAAGQFLRQLGDLFLFRFDQWKELLHLSRKPPDLRVHMVTAAWNTHAVSAKKSPILRARIIKPQFVLCDNGLAQPLETGIRKHGGESTYR